MPMDIDMKLLEFNGNNGKIYIPCEKITGFCVHGKDKNKTFIATGADGVDGGENGWSVNDSINDVKTIIENA
jgi:hypothetical protein